MSRLYGFAHGRFQIELEGFPLAGWKTVADAHAHGHGSEAVKTESAKMFKTPKCCVDRYFWAKIMALSGTAHGFIQGPWLESLVAVAPSVSTHCADIERGNARDRQANSAKNPLSIMNLGVHSTLQGVGLEHKRRGGSLPSGITSSNFLEAGVDTMRGRKRKRKKRHHAPRPAVSAYMYYHNTQLQQWAKDEVASGVRASAVKVVARTRPIRSAAYKQRLLKQGRGILARAKAKDFTLVESKTGFH